MAKALVSITMAMTVVIAYDGARLTGAARAAAVQAPAAAASSMPVAEQNAIVQKYCVTCHNDNDLTAGLSLQGFDASHPEAGLIGDMVAKLRAGEMPPKDRPRPDAGTLYAFITALSAEAVGAPAASHAPAVAASASAAPQIVAFPHEGDRMSVADQNAMLHTICTQCHTDARKPGNLSFEHFDMTTAPSHAEIAERMLAKLRAGMMPPQNAPKRPDAASIHAFVTSLEGRIDRQAALHPEPGSRSFQRLNRVEYAQSIKRLTALDVDVTQWLPPDTMSHNFDNIAEVQTFSPTLMQAYLDAADEISRLAVGDRGTRAVSTTYDANPTASQMVHVPGAPFGTRGGIAVTHIFPADGTYGFDVRLFSMTTGELYGSTVTGEQLEISVDGRRVALLPIDPTMRESKGGSGVTLKVPPVEITAGPHEIAAAFLGRSDAAVDDLMAPQAYTLADPNIGNAVGVTTLPHVRILTITGPMKVTGISDTISRRRIFTCRPASPDDELRCAMSIVRRLSGDAYRRPATSGDLEPLMTFYRKGRQGGSFEDGIRMALQAILSSPQFLFRLEPTPVGIRTGAAYRISDVALASRLSYFLWATPPDAALMKLATEKRLHEPAVLDAQVKRMLQDPRSYALSTRFAAQWLRLQDVDKVRPDALMFPQFDATLAEAMKTETKEFFHGIVAGDRDVMDLLTADYTYVNERLAAFYGIPNVAGPKFRKVSLAGTHRRGLLGEGSILVETSIAERTDPVLRGKWVLEVLLGQPPPPPPPNVPPLDATGAVTADGHPLSVRQRMEEHRKNPFCASCHRVIDPIGLSLENFDPTGHWRIHDNDVAVDASTVLYDGTPMNGPEGLERAMLSHRDTFLRVFTENLMAYALGRKVEYFDMPTVRAVIRRAEASGDRFSAYVLGIVNSDAFQMNRAGTLNADSRETQRARKGH